MKNNSIRRLERLANRILIEHGIAAPPVPLDRLAEQLGADLRVGTVDKPLRGFFVAIAHKDVKPQNIIFVNSAYPQRAQRSVLAHEIGHMLLRNDIHVDWPDPAGNKRDSRIKHVDHDELLADQLALELVLPRHMLHADVEQPLDPLEDKELEELAARYDVTLYSLIKRLEQLQLLRTRESPQRVSKVPGQNSLRV